MAKRNNQIAGVGLSQDRFERVPGKARRYRLKGTDQTFSRRQYMVLTTGLSPERKAQERREAGIPSPQKKYREVLDRYIDKREEIGKRKLTRREAQIELRKVREKANEIWKKRANLIKDYRRADTNAERRRIAKRIENIERPGGILAKLLEQFTRRESGADYVVGDTNPEESE